MSHNKETLGFETETKQLLQLVIHSLYGEREIFLRELVSNASDALDKLRFESVSNADLQTGDAELSITIDLDKEAGTLTITDNGIGMSRDEVVANIGTIAKSGTAEFVKTIADKKDHESALIGQFGVGFYAAFMVADKVVLTTRRADHDAAEGVRWESDGAGEYSVETVTHEPRGTSVTVHLREDSQEFLESYRVESIIRKYSDHITFPVMLMKPVKVETPVDGEDDDAAAEPKQAYQTINKATALWTRSKADITEEEYNEFYRQLSHDFQPPLARSHNRVEGKYEYTSLVFIPTKAPFDLWDRGRRQGVKLYVKRVFIMDDAEHLLPPYLRFVKGVIDSDDLPLNVSREILQDNKLVDSIRSGTTRKVLDLLEDVATNQVDKYQQFWDNFGQVLKEGVIDDYVNKDKIAGLLRFASTFNDEEKQRVSLADYAARMKPGQEAIYYITGESHSMVRHSPHLEVFRKKGIEVLLLGERIDEWVTGSLPEFDGKPLQSAARGKLNLDGLEADESESKKGEKVPEMESLVGRLKEILSDKVAEVRTTNRLTDSPACLVIADDGMSKSLEQILRAAGQAVPNSKPTLEINPDHPIIKKLDGIDEADDLKEWAWVLHDQALLSEGGRLDNPAEFVRRINQIMAPEASVIIQP